MTKDYKVNATKWVAPPMEVEYVETTTVSGSGCCNFSDPNYVPEPVEKVGREAGLHQCDAEDYPNIVSNAIEVCYEKLNGTLWVENDEYDAQVNYCPYCGYPAKSFQLKYLKDED